MSRIRTVKPELFRHEELFEAEFESSLPLRLAFIGLFTVADCQGRFRWKPRTLKLDVLPHDQLDFADVLAALERAGFIRRYSVDGKDYGLIPSFLKHQQITGRECDRGSNLPPPPDCNPEQVPELDRASTGTGPVRREGKGMEGNGKGMEVVGRETRVRACEEPPPAAADFEELIKALPVPLTDIIAAYHRLSPLTIPCIAPYTAKLLHNIAERCRPDLDQLPALENWEAYFEYVNESPLLTGQAAPRDGYATSFVADLEWLTDANNYRKIAEERRFHRGLPKNNHRQDRRHGIH